MPGSSLWLVPPRGSSIHSALQDLISSAVPGIFPALPSPPPAFHPHVTLTSDIAASLYASSSPQAWLQTLALPAAVRVRFLAVDTEAPFFRKCSLRVAKAPSGSGGGGSGLALLAHEARRIGVLGGDGAAAQRWVEDEYRPHCSLLYADTTVTGEQLERVAAAVAAAGIRIDDAVGEGEGEGEAVGQTLLDGWKGGEVWLVPTEKDIAEWKPIAIRTLGTD